MEPQGIQQFVIDEETERAAANPQLEYEFLGSSNIQSTVNAQNIISSTQQ